MAKNLKFRSKIESMYKGRKYVFYSNELIVTYFTGTTRKITEHKIKDYECIRKQPCYNNCLNLLILLFLI